jgi:ATP diphosphatase
MFIVSLSHTEKLLSLMARLRDPNEGCPWDIKQTFASLSPYTIEEAYEVADAIERHDMSDLRAELGDLLLQVVFYAQMAEEQGLFNFEQVAAGICEKLIVRHPHVFDEVIFNSDTERQQAWELAKEQERAVKQSAVASDASVLAGIATNLPSLMQAEKIQDRAAQHGFDWPKVESVLDKVLEEFHEVKAAWQGGDPADIHEEIGDLLLVTVNLARHLKVNPEQALKTSIRKFSKRFQHIEQQVALSDRRLRDCSLEELEAYWQQAKQASFHY